MQEKTLEYFIAPVSPFVYLGHARLVALAQQHGAAVNIKPMDLARVFPASGGLPLGQRSQQRQAYRLVELRRWSAFLGIPMNVQPKYFPCQGDLASRWILAVTELDPLKALAFVGAISRALWSDELNVADAATLATVATATGLDALAVAQRADQPHIAARYDAFTQEAVAGGVFGAPTYVYRGELYWGQDRLDFLARALAQ